MAMSLTEDFKTIDELRSDAEAILSQVRKTGRPVSISVQGKPAVVLLDVAVFERLLRTLNLARLVAPAEEDVLAGRTKPLGQFIKEFCLANEIPGPRKRPSSTGRANNSRLHRTGQKKRSSKVVP